MNSHKGLIASTILILSVTCVALSLGEPKLESLVPKGDLQDGWAIIGGPRIYNKKTLFEHINGEAELFIKYGFQESIFAVYQGQRKENQIDLDIYDMGNVLHAFGIFSRFRNEDRPAGIGLDSYLDERYGFFYKGRYFVMLYATESDTSILKGLEMAISSRIEDVSPSPKEIGYFPKNRLKPGSIQYFPEGLLGYQFFKKGFLGTYIEKDEDKVEVMAKGGVHVKSEDEDKSKVGDKELHLFLAVFKNSREAMGTLKIYRDHLMQKGKINQEGGTRLGDRVLRGEDPYQGKVIVVQRGTYLLGVVGFEKEKHGENHLAEFIKRVK
jgi:hypothetical protein